MVLKRILLASGIAVMTAIMLTGCGKADINIKMYDKDNELSVNGVINEVENEIVNGQNNNTTNVTNTEVNNQQFVSKKDEANNAIRKALKDEGWLKENILPEYFKRDDESSKKFQENTKLYFGKGHDIDEMPVYFVYVSCEMFRDLHLVTYKDGKVITSALGVEETFGSVRVDLNTNAVITETIGTDEFGNTENSKTYKIEDYKFVEFAQLRVNENDGDIYSYVNGEFVSYGRYKMYSENCVKLETELNSQNVDKYVK